MSQKNSTRCNQDIDYGYTGADSTGLSDSIFGTAIRCVRILTAGSCNVRKLAADHKTASCCVLKPWHVNCVRLVVKAAAAWSVFTYAQCVLLVNQVNDQMSRAKRTRTQHAAASVPCAVHSNSGGTPNVRNYICRLPQSRPSNTVHRNLWRYIELCACSHILSRESPRKCCFHGRYRLGRINLSTAGVRRK
jgi:hypothetical protein